MLCDNVRYANRLMRAYEIKHALVSEVFVKPWLSIGEASLVFNQLKQLQLILKSLRRE
jgi:hypothetical protein